MSFCSACSIGSYCPGDDTETPCADGYISSTPGATICTACDPGEYSNATNTGCEDCAVDTYSTGPTATCTPCPTKETASAGSSECEGVCGDGFRTASEDCDDGDTDKEDGCDDDCKIETGYYCVNGDPYTVDFCEPICGDGLKYPGEFCDDGDTSSNDGCSSTCTVETYYTCAGGTKTNPDTCTTICGDGRRLWPEECDDGNIYGSDGCTDCIVDADWECNDPDGDHLTPDECIPICGNSKVESWEQCDDGNTFDHDGCSQECIYEEGYICTGGSTTTPVTCIENEFMPSCELSITTQNDLYLLFNDTLYNKKIEQADLDIVIYGPTGTDYDFTWTAEFTENDTAVVTMNMISSLAGNFQEKVFVEFINTEKFKSIYSERGVNPEQLHGFLYEEAGSAEAGESLGKTAMYVFAASVGITAISSFGGNSMELMWNLMNGLQLMYFLSYCYLQFPEYVETFFSYLAYSNLNNQYFEYITLQIISEDKFTRGDVNSRIGPKAFYVSSADILPLLVLLVFAFIFTIIFSNLQVKDESNRCMKFLLASFEYLKYNFFIRFGTEVFLELVINCTINVYFYDYSTKYECISLFLSVLFLTMSITLLIFSISFLMFNRDTICNEPQKLPNFDTLFNDVDNKKEWAIYYYAIFFLRRLLFAFGLIFFYNSANGQIGACVVTSLCMLAYIIRTQPYKSKALNFFTIFNEICNLLASISLLAYSPIKNDSDLTVISSVRYKLGWLTVAPIIFCLVVNVLYLIPVKVYETFKLAKEVIGKIRNSCNRKKVNVKVTMKEHLEFNEFKKSCSFTNLARNEQMLREDSSVKMISNFEGENCDSAYGSRLNAEESKGQILSSIGQNPYTSSYKLTVGQAASQKSKKTTRPNFMSKYSKMYLDLRKEKMKSKRETLKLPPKIEKTWDVPTRVSSKTPQKMREPVHNNFLNFSNLYEKKGVKSVRPKSQETKEPPRKRINSTMEIISKLGLNS